MTKFPVAVADVCPVSFEISRTSTTLCFALGDEDNSWRSQVLGLPADPCVTADFVSTAVT